MRKFTRSLIPAALVFALAACGGSTPAESDDGGTGEVPTRGDADLVIWTDPIKLPAVEAVAETFAAANGISVAVQAVATDLQPNFVTANAAGNGPDVVVGAHDWIGNLVQNGSIDPLQLTPEQLQGYSEKAVQATTYDGQLYGVPYGIEAIALYRNTDVVADEPANLDEAIADGLAAVEAGEVAVGGDDLEVRALPQVDRRLEVPDDEGDPQPR
jgi:arabinogalactan oligomer/maltooligosaccharide transport system substrate-binding protein